MKPFYSLLGAIILFCSHTWAQSTYAPLDASYYHTVDRYEVLSGHLSPYFHTSVKPYTRQSIAQFIDSTKASLASPTINDEFNWDYLTRDNWEFQDRVTNGQGFYKHQSDLYSAHHDNFDLHIRPVVHLAGGTEAGSDITPFMNSRGVQVHGTIDDKIGFYTFLSENQASFPRYVHDVIDSTGTVPYEGFWKDFKDTGIDFFNARGYVTFRVIPSIQAQAGHDKLFIGNGYRSLILSDVSNNYTFLRLNTNVWKLQYTNLWAKMQTVNPGHSLGTGKGAGSRKYLAHHHLSLNIGKNFNFGVFESIVVGAPDSIDAGTFNVDYLNPIIFYRAVEQQEGSEDNVIIGADFKWNLWQSVSLYGQFVLDEFLLEHIRAQDGWWANKYAIQGGIKYIDAFTISNLDLQLEANVARPFTYAHTSLYTSYTHYQQPLAHPLGANFREGIGILRYQFMKRFRLTAKGIYAEYGTDIGDASYGKDVTASYNDRVKAFNNTITQGELNKVLLMDFSLTYQPFHNVFLDLRHIYRKQSIASEANAQVTNYSAIGVRYNIAKRNFSY